MLFAVLLGIWHYVLFGDSTGAPRPPWVKKRFAVGFGLLTAGLRLGIALLISTTG